jgi:hypothetical protein
MYKKFIFAAFFAMSLSTMASNIGIQVSSSPVEFSVSAQKEKSRKAKIKEIKKALVNVAKDNCGPIFDEMLTAMTDAMGGAGGKAAEVMTLMKKSFKLYEKKYFAQDLATQYDAVLDKLPDADIDRLHMMFADPEILQCYEKLQSSASDMSVRMTKDMMSIVAGNQPAKVEKVQCADVYRQLADIQMKGVVEESSVKESLSELESLGEAGIKMANNIKDYINNDVKEFLVQTMSTKLTESEAQKLTVLLADSDFNALIDKLSNAFNSDSFKEDMTEHLKECMVEVMMQGATM